MTAFLEQSGYLHDARANIWCRPDHGSISYSDGDETEERLRRILEEASDLSVLSAELRASCTDWPSVYHLSGTRANILRPCENLLHGDILEVGAGCGAITRYLGESGANVFALEGSFRRASIARARTRDLANVTVIAERFDDFHCDKRFDAITLIGVLEYANLFTGGHDPHGAMLERVRSLLKPDGKIIIAIENQLGLKYFAGAPEDHLGRPMYGIEGRYQQDQPQTFGREVLAELLQKSGYRASQFLAPFPDYKLPAAVVSEAGMKHKDFDAAALAAQTVRRDRQLPPYCNFALELVWPHVFDNGLALDLANSFLIIASPSDAPLGGPDALAYYYSTDRLAPYCKETTFCQSGTEIEVAYKPLGQPDLSREVDEPNVLQFNCPAPVFYSKGRALSLDFVRIVTREEWTIDEVGAFLVEYVRRLAHLAGRDEASLIGDSDATLPGEFFDILPQNIIIKADDRAEIIDKEWSTAGDVAVQRLLFRALLWLSGSPTAFGNESSVGVATRAALIRHGLGAAGYPLTDERCEELIELECVAQSQVVGRAVSEFIRRWVDDPLPRYTIGQALGRRDGEIAERDREIAERDREIATLVAHEADQAQRIAELNDLAEVRDRRLQQVGVLLNERERMVQALGKTVEELQNEGAQRKWLENEIQQIRATKLFRLREAIVSEGFGLRKIARIGYLSATLITPRAVRKSLGPVVLKLRRTLGTTPSSMSDGIPNSLSVGLQPQSKATDDRGVTAMAESASMLPDFDADLYLMLYPDIREAGIDPYQHYVQHGKNEGRVAALPVVGLHDGFAGIDPDRETVLVVSHEASRSGAPILSLNIIRHLKKFNVVSLMLGEGPLLAAFQAASAVMVGPVRVRGNQIAATYVVDKLVESFDLKFAITNSVESSVVLKGLTQHGVPTVSLIHEFAAYTRPHQVFPEAIRWASESVFSANVTYENAVSLHPDLLDASCHVLPQGRCEIDVDDGKDKKTSLETEDQVRRMLRPEGTTDDTVVVLGLGTVQLRKGVDLFLDVAAKILRSNPDGNIRFVWFGKGYDPDSDMQYSAYLIEQIRRSGLEKHVAIVDETPSIEVAYRMAYMLLVTSRLDPLPNVAIDSMTTGLPVLCFERATGIADILMTGGLGAACVSSYLDTEQMAAQALALIRSKSLHQSIGEQSRRLALKTFDMPKYVEELERLASVAVVRVVQQREDVETILGSGTMRFDFYDGPSVGQRPAEAKVLEHVRSWATGVNRRKAMPGFDPGIYMEQNSTWRNSVDPTASFLREGQPDGPWKYEVITEVTPALNVPNGLRVALHVHAYYADILPNVIGALNENSIRPDLYISVGEWTDRRQIDNALRDYAGSVIEVTVVPNRGRDIGPFLTQFGETFAGSYDIVGHLHTKKTADLEAEIVGRSWYRFLLKNLLGGENRMADIIVGQFANDELLGLVFPDDPHEVGWGKNRVFAEPIARRLGIGPLPQYFSFPVGTMFWAKVNAIRPLFDMRLAWDEYPAEPLPYDGSTLHALERLLSFVVSKQGYRFAVTNVNGVTR